MGELFSASTVIEQVDWCIKQLGAAGLFQEKHFIRDRDHPWSVLATTGRGRHRLWSIAWAPPPFNAVKLNTDASVSPSRAYGGGIIRNHDGQLVFAFYKEFGEVNVLLAKALALWWGLRFCQ